MNDPLTAVALAGAALCVYALGWGHGRSSGKVQAIEAMQDVDLSGQDGDRDE